MKIDVNSRYRLIVVSFCVLCLSGCATSWQDNGTFFQTTQTQLTVKTEPKGKVYVNSKFIGDTPLTTTFEYGREILRKKRSVSYWRTQPGLALFVSLISLGVYLPFSVIPVDTETSLEPTGSFKGNQFEIKIDAVGFKTFQDKIICTGQDKLLFEKQLTDRMDF